MEKGHKILELDFVMLLFKRNFSVDAFFLVSTYWNAFAIFPETGSSMRRNSMLHEKDGLLGRDSGKLQ